MSLPTHAQHAAPVLNEDGWLSFDLVGHEDAQHVHLLQEVRRPRHGPAFERIDGGWRGWLDPGPVDRLEYRLAITNQDGHRWITTDPHNGAVVDNPFGARSVWTRPGYEAPWWVRTPPNRHGHRSSGHLRSTVLGSRLPVRRWTHPDLHGGEEAPLVVIHDGPAFDDEAALGRLLDHLVDDGDLPPFRAALVGAPDRERTYSANPAYARAMVTEVLPTLAGRGPRPGPTSGVVGVGASLGALAHLHTELAHPGTFAALLLQSGSFFRPLLDGVEAPFPWFRRITDFTDDLVANGPRCGAVPTTLTCGFVEENLANNVVVADALRGGGWHPMLIRHRDAHNMTSWRDVLDPHLRWLLRWIANT